MRQEKLLIKIRIILLLIFCHTLVYGDENQNDYYHLNINGGADIAQGLNIGVMALPLEHISIGINYGRDVLNFVAFTDQNNRFSISGNYNNANMMIGLTYTKILFINDKISSDEFIFSLNIGSYAIYESGLSFFYRFGILLWSENNNAANKIHVWPNIGLGANFNLF